MQGAAVVIAPAEASYATKTARAGQGGLQCCTQAAGSSYVVRPILASLDRRIDGVWRHAQLASDDRDGPSTRKGTIFCRKTKFCGDNVVAWGSRGCQICYLTNMKPDDYLPFRGSQRRHHCRDRTAEDLTVDLRQFSADNNTAFAQITSDILQCLQNPMRRLKEDDRPDLVAQRLEPRVSVV